MVDALVRRGWRRSPAYAMFKLAQSCAQLPGSPGSRSVAQLHAPPPKPPDQHGHLLPRRVLPCCRVASICVSAVFLAKQSYVASGVLALTNTMIIYHVAKQFKERVGGYAHSVPLPAAKAAPRAAVDPGAYLPPPLRRGAVGWYPEWGLPWEKYGIVRYCL